MWHWHQCCSVGTLGSNVLPRSLEGNWPEQACTHIPLSRVGHLKSITILGPSETGYNLRILLRTTNHMSATVTPDPEV